MVNSTKSHQNKNKFKFTDIFKSIKIWAYINTFLILIAVIVMTASFMSHITYKTMPDPSDPSKYIPVSPDPMKTFWDLIVAQGGLFSFDPANDGGIFNELQVNTMYALAITSVALFMLAILTLAYMLTLIIMAEKGKIVLVDKDDFKTHYNKSIRVMARTSMLLALGVVIHAAHSVLMWPGGSFLKIDLDIFVIVLAYHFNGLGSAIFIAIAKEWLGGIIFGLGTDFPVGLGVGTISNILFIITYALVHAWFDKVMLKMHWFKNMFLKKEHRSHDCRTHDCVYLVDLMIGIFSTLFIAIILTVLNQLLFLDWYAQLYGISLNAVLKTYNLEDPAKLWAIIMPFNLVNFAIPCFIGPLIYKSTSILKNP